VRKFFTTYFISTTIGFLSYSNEDVNKNIDVDNDDIVIEVIPEFVVGVEEEWQVEIYPAKDVPDPVNYPHIAYYPDGHLSVLPDGNQLV